MLCATSLQTGRKIPQKKRKRKKRNISWDLELAKYEFPSLLQTNMQPQSIVRTRPVLRREAIDS